MKLNMALGSAAPTSFQHRCGVTMALILIVSVTLTKSAPTTYDEIEAKRTDLADYFNDPNGCYYNYQHYEEGDRIVTNEPCLNCTCHNRMLMCYLRVCPFSKAIGQDCTVQKSPDQCCPVISCPEVPVHLLTSSTTPTPTTTTEIGWHDNYGCMMDENEFFPDGAQVPPNPKKPCELCYCIRNRTACIMQECTLHVEGCRPVYHEGVCCPVRYDCDYESEKSTTSAPQITGGLVFSTTSAPFDCRVNDDVYQDGESIPMVSEKPCEHCYCMRGDIVCAVQDCGEPLRGKDCTPETPPAGQCCPTSYQCANETSNSYDITTLQPVLLSDSDENEAEKFPINEDIYNKLGETQPTIEHDEENDVVESDHTITTAPDNYNTEKETNIIPESNSAHNSNEENKQETSSSTPNLTNQENLSTESGQANYDSTDKPDEPTLIDQVQPTQLPASDPSTNENPIISSTQTISNKNDNDKVDEENNSNEISDKTPITSNLPVSSTDSSIEGSTQSSNIQDKPLEDNINENNSELEKEPIKSNDKEQTPDQHSNTKPDIETASDENKNPPKQSNLENSEISTEINIQTVPSDKQEEAISGTELPKIENQNSPQSENASPTEIPKVENEPTEQNKPVVDSTSGTDNQPESDKTPVEQNNQDSPQSENASATEVPKVENEPTEQNKPVVDSTSGTDSQPESDKTPVEQNNQDSPQSENTSATEVPKVENEPIEQNKPIVDSTSGTDNQPESNKTPIEQINQDSSQSETPFSTEISSTPESPQLENKVPDSNPIQPVSPVASENNESTEQPNEENIIFVVSPTSSPPSSDNQVKGEETTSIINENNTSDNYSSTEKNEDKTVEVLKPSADDKTSFTENTDTSNILPAKQTETVTESQNVVPQANEENNENSINLKPIDNKGNSDGVTDNLVNSHEQLPAIAEHNDNKFGSNNPVSLEPVLTPTTEINYDVNTEVINHGVLVDDPSSQENQPIDVHSDEELESALNADSIDQLITHQTETPTESETSTNKYPLSADEHANDITTSLPQQQIVENNIPSVHPQVINSGELTTTKDETKTPNNFSTNDSLNQSSENYVPTEIVGVQNSEDVSNPTELPVLHNNNGDTPEQNNESFIPQEQSQDENVNKIVDQTTIYPDTSSDEKNNFVTSTASYLNNVDNVTPSSDKIETVLNEKPVKNTYEDISVESATIQAISGNIDNNADNLVTTNIYGDLPSTDAPGSQMVENEVSPSVNPSNNVETNVNNDRPENVVPQLSSNEGSTQYNEDDSSTNNPIQESSSVNIINDVDASTNVPYKPSPNDINQDSNTESELYTTQSPTELQQLNVFPIVNNGNPSESLQHSDKPFVSKTPDYVIDITTSVYSESSNAPESIITNGPIDSVSEVTTFNVDKNSDVVTESYENVQPGVPGEGSCLIDFVTYAHKAEVPKSNPCHEKCECLNSIVTCTSVNCPPAPPQHKNCIPLHPGNESWCCPTYMCEGGIEGMLFDNHNQLGSPQLISTVVLEDKPSEVDEKPQTDEEVSSTPNSQVSQEYNTLSPSQFDSNSNINSEGGIGVTEIPAHTEIPNRPIEDFVNTDNENDVSVTAVNLETIVNENPANGDKPEENNKPIESVQPIENTGVDYTTTSYVTDDQSLTNKPETLNNNEEQNELHNTVNESQDYPAPSTQVPENYEPAVTNVLFGSDLNRPEQNSESDVSISVTTYKPNDSIVNQQVDTNNKGSVETNNPSASEDPHTNPTNIVTDLPMGEVNPSEEGTQTPTIIADENPIVSGNNVDGLRPTSIDDIISSVYSVKDSVKNSLETSSKPTQISNEEIGLFENNYQSTIIPEDSLPDQYNNESQTTVSSVNSTPESQKTDVTNEILPESPSVTTEANISLPSENDTDGLTGVTQIPNIPPQPEVNSVEQGVSTDLSSNGPEVEATVDDSKIPVESPTTQSLPSSGEQDLANNGPETPSNPILSQVQNAGDPSTDSPLPEVPLVVDDNKTPEINTPLSEQHEVPVHDIEIAVKPATEEKPDVVNSPITSDSGVPAEVLTQAVVTGQPIVSTPDDSDKRFGESSSSSFRPPVQVGDDNKHENERPRPETSDTVHIPLDTETPAFNPSTNAPLATYPHKPSYTPIPQSTWTQKPFHQDSTSEAPLQPDQGFPDEYDDENEAVYGPGTCRYGGKIYVSAQQVPRDDPCDFCFCFRGDIICLQQSCPPPIFGCYQENIQGFCCPRYECPVAQATSVNVTTTTTSTTTMVPPHFFANAYRGAARRTGCLIHGHAYRVGEDVGIASGPCLECICGSDGKMKCDPKPCSPEPLLRKMMAEAVDQKRR
ncbi:mucin-17-like isoform X2 [Melanaphis sacchari]|uniref:mucin-17-like isoform X2 n=1 Tax=Melanaphis sacchari TaxID=742174 RepID=UPI000DC13658|nr:mucin-17-like isoform X2 [Melanaphis sacchari]